MQFNEEESNSMPRTKKPVNFAQTSGHLLSSQTKPTFANSSNSSHPMTSLLKSSQGPGTILKASTMNGGQTNKMDLVSNETYPNQPVNVRNSIVHNMKQQFGQTNHSEFSGTHESDSKKFRRISDKSEDNQRFFKNLVDLPNNSNGAAAIKPHSNNEISKSDVGSRGTTGKNI